MSSFGDDSAAYTCSSVSDKLVSANGNIDPIPIPRDARAALEDPIDGSKWRLAMEAEIKGSLEANSATVSNIYNLAIDGSTLRTAIYVDNVLVGNKATSQDKTLRFDIEVMGTPTRSLGMEIAWALPSPCPSKADNEFL